MRRVYSECICQHQRFDPQYFMFKNYIYGFVHIKNNFIIPPKMLTKASKQAEIKIKGPFS